MAQRLIVGVTGLGLVMLLILAASIIYRLASTEAPPDVAGAPKPETLANMTAPPDSNASVTGGSDDDPLATLGIAPGPKAADTPTPAPSPMPTLAPSPAPTGQALPPSVAPRN